MRESGESERRARTPRRPQPGTQTFLLRGIPVSVFNRLARDAAAEDRSITGMMIHVLREHAARQMK